MNRQRKVVITTTYNEMGTIIDIKAEELDSSAQPTHNNTSNALKSLDCIDRQAAIDALCKAGCGSGYCGISCDDVKAIEDLPSAQPERKWTPCSNPPKHHKDVIVRGIEAIGNVTVHKVMQWDVDTWRPTDYAPSIMWKEWSEI